MPPDPTEDDVHRALEIYEDALLNILSITSGWSRKMTEAEQLNLIDATATQAREDARKMLGR